MHAWFDSTALLMYVLRRILVAGAREFLVYLGATAGERLAKKYIKLGKPKAKRQSPRPPKRRSRGRR